jgi:sugar phosphate isomerase/epimerase
VTGGSPAPPGDRQTSTPVHVNLPDGSILKGKPWPATSACRRDLVGLIIDSWHTERAHTPPTDLAAVPLRHIVGVELSDADPEPIGTLFEDTVHRRRLCGEGTFDLPGIIRALRSAGRQGPWGVEILSDQHRHTPLREAVAAAYRTAQDVLTRHS